MGEILHFGKMGVKGVAVCCAAFAATALLASSCLKRELYVKPDEGYVILDFDWKNVVKGETAPEKMAVYFYGSDGTLARTVVAQQGHCSATLASGNYKVLALNKDVAGVELIDTTNFDKAYAHALSANGTTKAGETDTETWILQPGWLYSANIAELTVNKEDTLQRTLVPDPLVRKLDIKFSVSGDADKVTKVTAALTGVASAVNLATRGCKDGYTSVVGFTPKKSETDASVYSASVRVFGVKAKEADGTAAKNLLKLWVEFNSDGNNSQIIDKDVELDLGGDTTGGGTGGDVNIDIDIDVEVSATSEAGFEVTVKGWEVTTDEVEVDNR